MRRNDEGIRPLQSQLSDSLSWDQEREKSLPVSSHRTRYTVFLVVLCDHSFSICFMKMGMCGFPISGSHFTSVKYQHT